MAMNLKRVIGTLAAASLLALCLVLPSFAEGAGQAAVPAAGTGECTHNGQRDCYGISCIDGGEYLLQYKEFPNQLTATTYEGKCSIV
jgi:hypothetical protein